VIATAGALLGVAIAPAVIQALLSFLPQNVATVDLSAEINPAVFAFALAAALVTAVLFSVAPAIRAARAEPSLALREESSAVSPGIGVRKLLVVGQIALALVLLIGAGLFVRTLSSLRAKGPGFKPTDLILFRIDTIRNGYAEPDARRLVRNLRDAIRNLPGVEHVALSIGELLSGGSWNQQVTIDAGRRFVTDNVVHCNAVTPGFFETLGVPVVAGRDFVDRDADETVSSPDLTARPPKFRVAIINESLARRYFGDRDPIGAHIGLGNQPGAKTGMEIIGVVRTFSYRGMRDVEDQIYFPFFQGPVGGANYWIRTRVEAASLFGSVRAAIHDADPSLPAVRMRTVDAQVDRSLANERLLAMLATAFAGLATLLALVGVYGVMSFVVSHRTREIGIRVALGASRGRAVWLILKEAVMLVCGVAVALPAAWSLGRLLGNRLFGVRDRLADRDRRRDADRPGRADGERRSPVSRATAINPMRPSDRRGGRPTSSRDTPHPKHLRTTWPHRRPTLSWTSACPAAAPCQCTTFAAVYSLSPRQFLDRLATLLRAHASFSTINNWPRSWLCHAVRAQVSDVVRPKVFAVHRLGLPVNRGAGGGCWARVETTRRAANPKGQRRAA
jgi:predicted permease